MQSLFENTSLRAPGLYKYVFVFEFSDKKIKTEYFHKEIIMLLKNFILDYKEYKKYLVRYNESRVIAS